VNTRVLVAAAVVLVSLAFPSISRAQGVLSRGIWIDRSELMSRPTSGTAWNNLLSAAQQSCGTPDLADQEDQANVCVMAKALVFARTGNTAMRSGVISALNAIVNSGTYYGRALAIGRELGAYPIAADLIDLKTYDPNLDSRFRSKIRQLLTTATHSGPRHLIECHEKRPNNWGNHCGWSRVAVAAYLGDTAQLARAAQVFKGYLGDRASYAGFVYGTDLSWQCNPNAPVGINAMNCTISGRPNGGVLPDDQRRAGSFTWPPPQENYVYEGLQGAMAEAVVLKRAGYDPFNWQNQALLRAFKWLQQQANFLATGDDTWLPWLVNYHYGAGTLPASAGTRPGKNVGWTDWSHSGTAPTSSGGTTTPPPTGGTTTPPPPTTSGGTISGTFTASADAYVRGGTYGSTNYGTSTDIEVKNSTATTNDFHRRTFLKFQVGQGTVGTRALLRFYVRSLPNGTPAPVCAFGVTSDNWTEGSITWSNQPAAGSSLACASVSATGWASLDVTAFVKSQASTDGVVTLMLNDSSQTSRMSRIDSRETSNAPNLVVN